tara:strand:+ start:3789 stop:3974 length:186 start_codon:yes stop_codon:yes gene_type:complete
MLAVYLGNLPEQPTVQPEVKISYKAPSSNLRHPAGLVNYVQPVMASVKLATDQTDYSLSLT